MGSMEIKFNKYHGAGNDFIIIDNRSGNFDLISTTQIQFLCNRFKGIGADGVIFIETQKYMNFLFVYLHPSEEIHNKKTTIH